MNQPSLFPLSEEKQKVSSVKQKKEEPKSFLSAEPTKVLVHLANKTVAVEKGSKVEWIATKTLPPKWAAKISLEANVSKIETASGTALAVEPIDATKEPFWLELEI